MIGFNKMCERGIIMVMLIIFLVAGLISGIVSAKIEGEGYVYKPIGLTIVGFLMYILICLMMSATISTEKVIKEEKTLNSIVLNSDTQYSGSFFLISGSFGSETETKYYYMSYEELGYKVSECDVENAYINFTDEQPKVVIYTEVNKDVNLIHKLFGFDNGNENLDATYSYQFFIPENGFTEIYDVDLDNLMKE